MQAHLLHVREQLDKDVASRWIGQHSGYISHVQREIPTLMQPQTYTLLASGHESVSAACKQLSPLTVWIVDVAHTYTLVALS